MATEPPSAMICFRALPRFKRSIEEAARIRKWSRTTWILYWLGKGLDHDRELFGLTDDEIERDRQRQAAKVVQVRRWRERRRHGLTTDH